MESKETRLRNSHIKTEILLESLIFSEWLLGKIFISVPKNIFRKMSIV